MEASVLRGEDLIVSVCVKEECVAGKQVDFCAKDARRYYTLHLRNGALSADGDEQILKHGGTFIIPPDKDVSYRTIDRREYFCVNIEGKPVWPLF